MLKTARVEQPLRQSTGPSSVFGPYIHFSVHDKSGDGLPRTAVLHSGFLWINAEARVCHDVLQSVPHFPGVCFPGHSSGYGRWKIGFTSREGYVVSVSRILQPWFEAS